MNLHRISMSTNATLRLSKSHRLVTTVLVLSSHSCEFQNIFLKTIATAATFFLQFITAQQGHVLSHDEDLWQQPIRKYVIFLDIFRTKVITFIKKFMPRTCILQIKRKSSLNTYRMFSMQEDETSEVSNSLQENLVPQPVKSSDSISLRNNSKFTAASL